MVHQRFQHSLPPAELGAPSIETAQPHALFFITDQYLFPYLDFVRENKAIYKAIHDQMGTFGAETTYQQFFQRLFSPILSRFGVPRELHGYIMAFYRHGLVAVLMQWVEDGCVEEPQQIARVIKLCVGERPL